MFISSANKQDNTTIDEVFFVTSTADLAEYSLSVTTYGLPESATRTAIAILSNGGVLSGAATFVSATLGGVSGTVVADLAISDTFRVTVVKFLIPTGSSGTLVATYSAEMTSCRLALYAVDGVSEITAGLTAATDSVTSDTITMPELNHLIHGVFFGASASTVRPSSFTGTDWTNNTTQTFSTTAFGFGSANFSKPNTSPAAVTLAWNGTVTNRIYGYVSVR